METREPTPILPQEHRIQNWVAPIRQEPIAIPVGADPIWFAQPTGYAMQIIKRDGQLYAQNDFNDPSDPPVPVEHGRQHTGVGFEGITISVPNGEISEITVSNPIETPSNRVVACIGGIVRSLRQQVGLVFARSMQLLKDSYCDIEFCDQTSDIIAVMTFHSQLLGTIRREEEKLLFENKMSGQAIELHEGENPIGLLYQPPNFFGNGDLLREVISDSHGCIEVKIESGKTYLRITTNCGLKISLLPKHLLRGEESVITEFHRDPDFQHFAICNNVDGRLDFPDAQIWGLTEIGGRIETKNEDGIYLNPAARVIAGVDGMGGEPHGGLASSFALASVHSSTLAPKDNWLNQLDKIAPNACADLTEGFQKRDIHIDSHRTPGTTFGFAREKTTAEGKKSVEGFTIGDYKALLIDVKNRRVLYESVDQKTGDGPFIDNCINPIGLAKDPVYFSHELQDAQEIATVLYSDGVSASVRPEEVAEAICTLRERGIAVITEAAKLRQTANNRDNVSICVMITHKRSECVQ